MKITQYLALAGIGFLSLSAQAEPAKSDKQAKQVAEFRQSIYKLTYSNMGPMGAMAKGKIPLNVDTVVKNSERIAQLSLMMSDYFKVDTRNFDVKTEALDKIWQEKPKFEEKINNLTLAANNLHTIAKSGDEAAIKDAIGKVGQACGSCHDDFKKE